MHSTDHRLNLAATMLLSRIERIAAQQESQYNIAMELIAQSNDPLYRIRETLAMKKRYSECPNLEAKMEAYSVIHGFALARKSDPNAENFYTFSMGVGPDFVVAGPVDERNVKSSVGELVSALKMAEVEFDFQTESGSQHATLRIKN